MHLNSIHQPHYILTNESENDRYNTTSSNPENCSYKFNIDSQYYTHKEFINNIQNKNKCFSIIHINIRSISKNFDNLIILLDSLNYEFDIIAISESWINDNNTFIYNIHNYNAYVSNRKHKHACGVLFYIRKQFSVKIIDIFTNNYFQSIILEIDDEHNKMCICLIYRAPSLDFN